MSNTSSNDNAVSRLASQSDAVGRLAQDSGGFAAVVAAFESKDANAFRWVLERLEMLPYCELICEWVRIKLCVLRCVEVCGPPREKAQVPDLQQFARAVVQLSSNEKLLRRVVDAISCGDGSEYRAVLNELKLGDFCQLLFYWVCFVSYDRVCEIVCRPQPVPVPLQDSAAELRAAGESIAAIVKKEEILNAVAKAAVSLDSETLQSAINGTPFASRCEFICHLICVWRLVWVCRELCDVRPPILTGAYAIEEAQNFALVAKQLASQPRALADLVNAVQNRNVEAYREILTRYNLGPYCWQVCAWVGAVTCFEFCIRVCPPQLTSYFTSIGALEYATQIDSILPATGLTTGNPPQAFFSTLRLNGILTQTLSGQPLEYSFWYQPVTMASTTLQGAIGAGDTSITVASSSGFPTSGSFNVVIGSAGGGYEIMTVTNVSGTTWTVVRGQQGTAAAPAAVGATIVTGVAASASWTQVPQGWILHTLIGYLETPRPLPLPPAITNIAVDPVAGEIAAPFTSDGWIQVPQGSDIFLNGNMIILDSTMLPGFSNSDETAVTTGNLANPAAPTDLYFGIQMRVRQHGSSTSSPAGTCSVVAIDNNLYSNIIHHPAWFKLVGNNEYGVAMVDIKELQAAGCAGITDSLTVLFTASSPNLGSVSISMAGPGGPYGFTLPMPVPQTGDWYGTATNDFNLADLEPCAYIVTLSVNLLLTTGDSSVPGPLIDQIAFCLS
jgi:hypothetical protein